MGIENEVKYVLRAPDAVLAAFAQLDVGQMVEEIEQGYLNHETRIRRFRSDAGETLVFSFKRRLLDGTNVEIETDLSEPDFDLLWNGAGDLLRKKRIKFQDGDAHWDVDLFRDDTGAFYFAMAEAELPAGVTEPARLPPVIADLVVHKVSRDDARFTSRLVGEPSYGRALAIEVGVVALNAE